MSHIKLTKPAQGERAVFDNFTGKMLVLTFPAENAEFARSGEDLLINFSDNSSIALSNFYTIYAGTPLPGVVVDGVHAAGAQFFSSLNANLLPDAATVDTGGHFAVLHNAELMDGIDSLNQLVQEDPLDRLLPVSGNTLSIHEELLFSEPMRSAAPQTSNSLLSFASDDALFGGSDDDIWVSNHGEDKVYGDSAGEVIFYDETIINGGLGIDFLIQKTADSLDFLLSDPLNNADVLVRVGEHMDITNMNDLAHMGLTVNNNTLIFSEQWTREGNVFTNADNTAIVEVNASETDIQANMVRLTLENNS